MHDLTSKYLISSQDLGPSGPAYMSSPPRFINKSCIDGENYELSRLIKSKHLIRIKHVIKFKQGHDIKAVLLIGKHF